MMDSKIEQLKSLTSELNKREQKLIETKELYKLIIDYVVDGILTVNQDGIIKTANPAAREILGYQRITEKDVSSVIEIKKNEAVAINKNGQYIPIHFQTKKAMYKGEEISVIVIRAKCAGCGCKDA
jgi:PAS domain S-box-containing protein